VGGLTLVELPAHASAVLLVVQGAEDVDSLMDAANLGQGLVDAVLPCIGAESQQHQGRRDDACGHGGNQTHDLIPSQRYPVRFNCTSEDRVQVRIMLAVVELVKRLVVDVPDAWC